MTMNQADLQVPRITPTEHVGTRSTHFRAGAIASLPLLASAFPMGLVGGALGVASGLNVGQTVALSALLNSGTAQFLAFKLIEVHAATAVVVSASLILSLRMVIYALALRNKVKQLPAIWRFALGFGLIDAVFMVMTTPAHAAYTPRRWRWFYAGVSATMYGGWIVATVIGASLGETVTAHLRVGLDFPLVAVFGAMLASTLASRSAVVVCIVAGIASLLTLDWPYHVGMVISMFAGAIAGFAHDRFARSTQDAKERS